MRDIDQALICLSRDPVPDGLASIENVVLGRVAGHGYETQRLPARWPLAIVTGALVMGVAGGLLPREDARAQSPLMPIGGAGEIAPSTLLTGG